MIEVGLWKQRVSFCGASMRGTWRKGSFTGEPEGYAKKGSENRHLFPQIPRFLETWRDAPFLGPSREGLDSSNRGMFIKEFERHAKEGSGNRQLSLYGPLLDNLVGFRLLGPLRDR